MSVSAPIKTYEVDVLTYGPTAISADGDSDEASKRMLLVMKDMWQGQSHHGFSGTINQITPGVTYELVATNRSGHKLFNEVGAFNVGPSIVGKKIEITGATSGGNNGFFTITSVVNASTIRYTNATGVAEAFSGDYRVSNGKFTARGGAFPAWICKGSSAGSTGKGAGMDARDRWHTKSDLQITGGATGNHSWFVLDNTENGVEMLITNNFASVFRRINAEVSCENGFTGGNTTTDPTSTDTFRFSGNGAVNNGYWFMTDSWALNTIQLVFVHSTDGEQDYMIMRHNGINQGMLATGIAGAPETSGSIPWNGNNAYVIYPDGIARAQGLTPHLTFVEYNDSPRCVVTIDKDTTRVRALGYLTASVTEAATVPENFSTGYEPVGKTFSPERIGLFLSTAGVRGRAAYIPDLYWANGHETYGMGQGDSFPASGSRQWVKIGMFLIPWNGSVFEPR
jgi:hypothetical protein